MRATRSLQSAVYVAKRLSKHFLQVLRYGRGMLRGIVRYARLHGPWSFYITPGDFEQALPKMKLWGGSGIIARVETLEMAEAIVAAQIPAVLVGADQRVAAAAENGRRQHVFAGARGLEAAPTEAH